MAQIQFPLDTVSADVAPASAPPHRRAVVSGIQMRYLAKSVRLEEAADPKMTRSVIWSLSIVLLTLIAWASFATVPEVARARGKIAPQGFERVIQHADGGTIASLLVRQGERVEAGQIIAVLDGDGLIEDRDRIRVQKRTLDIRAERLRAYLENRSPDFSAFGAENDVEILGAQTTLEAMHLDLADRRAVITKQGEQRRGELAALRAELVAAREVETNVSDLAARQEKLAEKGLVRISQLAEIRTRASDARGRVRMLEERMRQGRIALDEFSARLSSVDSAERSALFQQLLDTEGRLEETNVLGAKIDAKLDRLEIRAPVAGRIKAPDGFSEGQFLAPGEDLAKIVPEGMPLVARVKVSPRDIGRIEVGQTVNVKISAYDFVRFGSIPGSLRYVSAGAFEAADGAVYFDAEVALDREHMGADARLNRITPGMTVEADIINGERTLVDYLFKPVKLALDGAFRES